MLVRIPPSITTIDRLHLDQQVQKARDEFRKKKEMLEHFVKSVKKDCALKKDFFNFGGLPDHIVQMKTTSENFDIINAKILQKVKDSYLKQKSGSSGQKVVQLTDDDLVPLSLLDDAISEFERKFEAKSRLWQELIQDLRMEIEKKKKQITCQEKQKKMISESVMAVNLNKRLEQARKTVFTKNFIFQKIFKLMKENRGIWTSAEDFKEKFEDSIELKSGGFQRVEFEDKWKNELNRFSGLRGDGDTTQRSENKSCDFQSLPSMKSVGELEKEDEDEEEEVIEIEETDAQKKAREHKELYKNIFTGQYFDPNKVFGTIDPERSLKYDDITTAYPVMLPAEYYYKYIKSQMPDEEKEKKWFIRPHHIENLTDHKRSIRDDVLNTHYFSHYNQKYGKVEEVNESAEAIKHIEHMLEHLKAKAEGNERNLSMEDWDDKRKDVFHEAQLDYE